MLRVVYRWVGGWMEEEEGWVGRWVGRWMGYLTGSGGSALVSDLSRFFLEGEEGGGNAWRRGWVGGRVGWWVSFMEGGWVGGWRRRRGFECREGGLNELL